MENCLVTWFYGEDKSDESFYPSVGGNTSSAEFQKVYWCCVYDFYRSAILTQTGGEKYLFFTNMETIPSDVFGIDMNAFLSEMGIEVVHLELSYKTPGDWYGAWRNQFYLFDILKYLEGRGMSNYLILDSDTFITKDLTPVFEDISKYQIISYDCGYSDTTMINGITNNQLKELYLGYKPEGRVENLTYKGGEFIGVSSSILSDLLECYRELWEYNYKLYEKQKVKLNEEAHFLSLIYHHLGHDDSIANKYIKRMWTALRHDNINKGDEEMLLWHMPAEKKYLFIKMAKYLKQNVTREEFLEKLKKWSGVPGPKVIRKIRRVIMKL